MMRVMMMSDQPTRGTLKIGEPHPMAYAAMEYIRGFSLPALLLLREGFATCSIEGNRNAEVCGETLQRLLDNQPVSDRYLLGLAWAMKEMGVESDGIV
jgi:hypothetical protein